MDSPAWSTMSGGISECHAVEERPCGQIVNYIRSGLDLVETVARMMSPILSNYKK